MHRRIVAIAIAFGVGVSAARVDENWAQWRGPDGLGISAATDYVDEWGPGKNIAWKTAVPGRGHSSPIVWGNRLFITTSIEGKLVPGHTRRIISTSF